MYPKSYLLLTTTIPAARQSLLVKHFPCTAHLLGQNNDIEVLITCLHPNKFSMLSSSVREFLALFNLACRFGDFLTYLILYVLKFFIVSPIAKLRRCV